tara:strand:- start:359 stop:505 length:147 start_codon:yes stop_codon:yes gene_type:complete
MTHRVDNLFILVMLVMWVFFLILIHSSLAELDASMVIAGCWRIRFWEW